MTTRTLQRDTAHEFGGALRRAGFAADAGETEGPPELRAPLQWLFGFGVPVRRDDLDLPPGVVEELAAAGLVTVNGDGLVSTSCRVTTFRDLLFLHDADSDGVLGSDHVTGIGPAARTLASLTLRTPVGVAVDIGTGCGAQALLAATHSETVIATDVNARALAMTKTNALLNGFDNVECRQGSFFEPLDGQQVDRIVCNPPFVIGPADDLLFRDGSTGGDVFEQVLTAAPIHLRASGTAHMLGSWVHDAGGAWSAPPRALLEDASCDAWVLRADTSDPESYARRWVMIDQSSDPAAFADEVQRWVDHFEQSGVAALASGAVFMRRRHDGEAAWFDADDLVRRPRGDATQQLERAISAADRLHSDGVGSLSTERLSPVPGSRLEQTLQHHGGAFTPHSAELVLDDEIGVSGAIDIPTMHVLFQLDGTITLDEAIQRVARQLAESGEDLRSTVLTTASRLFRRGFLRGP